MATTPHSALLAITERIRVRSAASRASYLSMIDAARHAGRNRNVLSCGNLAHGIAACGGGDKRALKDGGQANVGIITAYNDMLSAHQPFELMPAQIKAALNAAGAVGQVAGGVPAMCDGVTQGQAGMELSLFSRDIIAMSTAIALSHNMFDAALCLGVCDKIVPGLLIGALRFGHLPVIFVPAGPMRSGVPNTEKARVRQLFAEGKAGRDMLLDVESRSYHSPGTCTFYGTANSNQMLMEIMGLHIPGAAFINPDTPLRQALTAAAAKQATRILDGADAYAPIGQLIDERSIVNAIVGLHATGGSTNHTIHLVAIARAAGILIDWSDFDALAAITPLLCRIYPNGPADVNHFHAAGGIALVIRELLDAGLLHEDVRTVVGTGLRAYCDSPALVDGELIWTPGAATSLDETIIRDVHAPFAADGGLRLLDGNIGRAIIKVSAVKPAHQRITAPALVFNSQDALMARFGRGELARDFIAVLRFQGPRANGMPELHKLTPLLGSLQDRGFRVALVTDGRMSGASGKVPAAIHVSPEAALGGAIARVRDGDIITVDAASGELFVEAEEFESRAAATQSSGGSFSMGRELFSGFRLLAGTAEEGALTCPGLVEMEEARPQTVEPPTG